MSNTRFVKKTSSVSGSQINALLDYYLNGGKVTVVQSSKRPKRGFTVGQMKKKAEQ